jgi:Uma2 family endonuclease
MIHRRLKQYFEAGVKEVWLIDPDSREAEIWTSAALPETALGANDTLKSVLFPGFHLPLAELFA